MTPALGLPVPGQAPPMAVAAAPTTTTAKIYSLGGMVNIGNQAAALAAEPPAPSDQEQQAQPVIQGLAGHIRGFWTRARDAKVTVEQRMLDALRARRGEYTPAKLQQISEQRQPAIYMMLASAKMRQIESLLRDALIGTGSEKPWTLRPTPVPALPPSVMQAAIAQLTGEIEQAMASGFIPTMQAAQARAQQLKDELIPMLMEEARKRCERMEQKMEDQLLEGGYLEALDGFISDLSTFPAAFVAGPIIRRKAQLSWGDDNELQVTDELVPEWERVDPFDIYPAPWARNLDDAPFIRKHRLTRTSLNEMIGVEGFSEEAIRAVLEQYGEAGYNEASSIESQKAHAEGKTDTTHDTGLIDALQYWGTASGQMLVDWGLEKDSAPDPAKEYQIESWVVGTHVIKAVLNSDPLARRPVYTTSFQTVPGSVWGNSPYDLMRDCQDMCNAAARALAANLGISSGPQVAILSNRLPVGEEVTEMFPWKIWQFESDPTGSTAAPITFFQPQSNANELMGVYERFSLLADEYTGIPRYMAGFNGGEGGAGRTASGISMMIGNASKVIKQVLGGIDSRIMARLLERLHYHNMRYVDDPDLKGDIKVVPRGAMSLVAKDAAQVRNNEVLQLVLQSPLAQQIVGLEGASELLRNTVKTLDHNPDRVVPPLAVLKQRMAEQQQMQMLQMQAMAEAGVGPDGQPAQQKKAGGGEKLQDGRPTTDSFSPKPQ